MLHCYLTECHYYTQIIDVQYCKRSLCKSSLTFILAGAQDSEELKIIGIAVISMAVIASIVAGKYFKNKSRRHGARRTRPV